MKLLYCDTETGGLNPVKNPLLQLAGIIEIDGVEKEVFNYMIQPGDMDIIDEKALEVNDLTMEQIMGFDPPARIHAEFKMLMKQYVNPYDKRDKFHFIGYNSNSFDMPFIREFFKKQDDKFFGSWFFYPGIDVMLLTAHRLMGQRHLMENFKLHTVAKKMGISVEDTKLHEALYDVELTKKLYNLV